MVPTKAQWQAYYFCHKDHRSMSYREAAKEMGMSTEEVEQMLSHMEAHYPELFRDINGDKYCPGGLTVVNKHRYTGKPKIVRYGPDIDGRIRQKF